MRMCTRCSAAPTRRRWRRSLCAWPQPAPEAEAAPVWVGYRGGQCLQARHIGRPLHIALGGKSPGDRERGLVGPDKSPAGPSARSQNFTRRIRPFGEPRGRPRALILVGAACSNAWWLRRKQFYCCEAFRAFSVRMFSRGGLLLPPSLFVPGCFAAFLFSGCPPRLGPSCKAWAGAII